MSKPQTAELTAVSMHAVPLIRSSNGNGRNVVCSLLISIPFQIPPLLFCMLCANSMCISNFDPSRAQPASDFISFNRPKDPVAWRPGCLSRLAGLSISLPREFPGPGIVVSEGVKWRVVYAWPLPWIVLSGNISSCQSVQWPVSLWPGQVTNFSSCNLSKRQI